MATTVTTVDEYEQFKLVHSQQLEEIPNIYWSALYRKLVNEVYDAGASFMLTKLEDEEQVRGPYKVVVSCETGVSKDNENSVYLIDHAWTYQVEYAKKQLLGIPGLAHRIATLMGLSKELGNCTKDNGRGEGEGEEGGEGRREGEGRKEGEGEGVSTDQGLMNGGPPDEDLVECILKEMWKFNAAYSFPTKDSIEERVPLWYILDEFGSSIQHSDEPTFAMKPFYFANRQLAYNILWPLKDIVFGDAVTVDMAPNIQAGLLRAIHLLPWRPDSLLAHDHFVWEEVKMFTVPPQKSRHGDVWCDPADLPQGPADLPQVRPLSVYTDLELVKSFLTRKEFKIADKEEQADILWLTTNFKNFKSLSSTNKFINQFPCEFVITCKDQLAVVGQRAAEMEGSGASFPGWLPETYNLFHELPKMVHEYLKRKANNQPNYWIIKPWNLGRSLDTCVTDDINVIIRMSLPSPKVACRYLASPVLFKRDDLGGLVKFDFRYMLLLKSVQPLELYAYKVFWLRFANKPYSLEDLYDYETHFTVMNYREETDLKQIHCHDFVPMFNRQYPEQSWQTVEESVFEVFKEFFRAATSLPPPAGIAHCPQSRAIYAADLMLEWKTSGPGKGMRRMGPKLLEMNFSPDCVRACKYHPQFYNHMFATLFLGDIEDNSVIKLI